MLNTDDIEGGAARAAYRLHRGVIEAGLDSQMLVMRKSGGDHTVKRLPGWKGKAYSIAAPLIDQLPLAAYPGRQREHVYHTGRGLDMVTRHVRAVKPDLIHLHWINGGFVSVATLARLERPLIWTLHDMWPFTGGCHYSFDCDRYRRACGACPLLGSSRLHDSSYRTLARKQRLWQPLDLTVVTPSRWLADRARESALFADLRIEVIPNGIDLTQYYPIKKELARDLLKLPQHKRLVLFGALNSTGDPRKGFSYLRQAMHHLSGSWRGKAEAVILGADRPIEAPDLGMESHYLGRLHDDLTLALAYSAADVFVAPSVQENLANTVMEALACGTPCVAFDIGGMRDMIEDRVSGYLAQPYDPEDLAAGIEWVLGDATRQRAFASQARARAEALFDLREIARRYIDLYHDTAAG